MDYEKLVKGILIEQAECSNIKESDTWLDLGLDSLDIIECVIALEEELKFEIPDDIVVKYSDLNVSAFWQLIQMIAESK